MGKFKACVVEYKDVGVTEIVLEDTTIVWQPHDTSVGHDVDLGYNLDGKLVGVKFWSLVGNK
ncbi:MAG: hypothetical protein COA84_13400 [Robiginitomaculum sp.]|nr:MAG: hypothetical protein COA84_13400 [Robiginitomaculum sp.]